MLKTTSVVLVAFSIVMTEAAGGQAPAPPLRTAVFLDCHADCDFDFFRREVAFVDWARDRTDADVHLLIPSEDTGGGEVYTLNFIGLRRFAGAADTLHLVTRNTDVDDEIRANVVKVIKLGLVRFVAGTPAAQQLTVTYTAPAVTDSAATPAVKDPWNYWTFSTNLNGSLHGERRSSSHSYRVGTSANRVTDAWKIELNGSVRRARSEVEIDETTTFVNSSRDYSSNLLIVRSLGQHWSFGGVAGTQTSTFRNLDFQFEGGAGIEYDIFPYSVSSRKRFVFRYSAGARYLNYEEQTLFDRFSETHPVHNLEIQASLNQPWGSVYAQAGAFQYLHDPAKHNLSLFTNFNVRIVRGLSLNAFAEVERIKDQIFLPRGEATPEEIVAERRQLGTDYSFSINFGLSYRFGSKFNNVVNPRFD